MRFDKVIDMSGCTAYLKHNVYVLYWVYKCACFLGLVDAVFCEFLRVKVVIGRCLLALRRVRQNTQNDTEADNDG